jgi:hypothetical protein
VVTSLNPAEIFRTATLALRDGFVAAKKSLSRSSSWQSSGSFEETLEKGSPNEPNACKTSWTKEKQTSLLSKGTSNVSDVTPNDFVKKRRFMRFTSQRMRRKSTIPDIDDSHDDMTTQASNAKKAFHKRGSVLKKRKKCVIQ